MSPRSHFKEIHKKKAARLMANAKAEMTHRQLSRLREILRDCSAAAITSGRFLCPQNKNHESLLSKDVIEEQRHRSPFILSVQIYLPGVVRVPRAVKLVQKRFHFTKVFTLPLNVLNHWYYLWLYVSKAVLFVLFCETFVDSGMVWK